MPLLDWLNKDEAVKAASKSVYRMLEEVPELSYGDPDSGNLLIQGDNLEALKALLPFYAGKVKCIFIDPPYNTKSAFEHYDDNLEHSIWLSTIYPRLELLSELLAEDGSIWVTIDDNEAHYLKVIMDEIFGRDAFIASVMWENFYGRSNAAAISPAHNHILLYSPMGLDWKKVRNLLPRDEKSSSKYRNPDNDPRGAWRLGPIFANGERHEGLMYEVTIPSGRKVKPPAGSHWRMREDDFWKMVDDGRIVFGEDGDNNPAIKLYLKEVQDGVVPRTWWPHGEVGHTQEAKREIQALFSGIQPFDTPKPERLVERCIKISTNPGDYVLDSFLGSGTASAVAHKLSRRHIGIEMGPHAETLCQPRLKQVVDGELGGISSTVNWEGGSGFRFVRLGQKVFDEFGLLSTDIKFATLAAHVWFIETQQPLSQKNKSPLIGIHEGVAYYLLYNGILGDKRPQSGNVLTSKVLDVLPGFDGPKVIYGETTRLGESRLKQHNITFKQIPYDVKAL